MDITPTKSNSEALKKEFAWFFKVLQVRMELYFQQESNYQSIFDIEAPDLTDDLSLYAQTIREFNMGLPERLALLVGLAPHIAPEMLDIFFTKNSLYDRPYTEFGGLKGKRHSGFIPTGETAIFLLSGGDLHVRFLFTDLFDEEHFFFKNNILNLSTDTEQEPRLSGALSVSEEYLTRFTTGKEYRPVFSNRFPAKRLGTNLDWSDLVLENQIMEEVEEIHKWIKYEKDILANEQLIKRIKPGYRALFYGPPGTGKSLTAALLGKSTNRDVYRVDISQLVSKFIGETEKNLANIFNQAENKNWILFFDEADALFGKRSETKDAQDRYANQEIAYLLQRIEDHPSIILLATNLKNNIDSAFARRFQSMIYFPLPDIYQRQRLWLDAFGKQFKLDDSVDLRKISRDYKISGGSIINVLRHCALVTAGRSNKSITNYDILEGIRREFRKEGKVL
jgi:Cdc6-like AAA superfamily ATPase